MRLTEIKLAGFKSFVDAAKIPVPGRIVGIVGPNGCGKSNIIDAVRWVLGESKASALRGDSLQDVIFNGSASRKAVARASVELIFDNSLGRAQGQWSQYSEIAVKRVLQREGESGYFINNLRVRRRDITDLFLGTGLAGRGYAIIEQGMIARIIEADPVELRVFLEEAAGISRYRERRRETESRLGDARINLERVSDICRELGEQIGRLDIQAGKAKIHNELTARKSLAQRRLWQVKKNQAGRLRERYAREAALGEVEMEAIVAQSRALESELLGLRADADLANESMQQAQAGWYQAKSSVAQLEQEMLHLEKRREQALGNSAHTRRKLQEIEEEKFQAENNWQHWKDRRRQAEQTLDEAYGELRTLEAQLPAIQEEAAGARMQFSAKSRELNEIERDENVGRANLNHIRRNIVQLDNRYKIVLLDKSRLPACADENLSLLQQQQAGFASEIAAGKNALDEWRDSLSELEKAVAQTSSSLQQHEREQARLAARRQALAEVQHPLAGDEVFLKWLQQRQLENLPRLWSQLSIRAGWEAALESVLGIKLNAIFTPGLDAVTIDSPPQTVVLLESSENDAGAQPDNTLYSLIQCREPGLEPILRLWTANFFPADSVQAALASRGRLAEGDAFITCEGHIVFRHALQWHGQNDPLHGVLARVAEIAKLGDDLRLSCEQAALQRSELARMSESLRARRQQIGQMQDELTQVEKKYLETQLQMERLQLGIERINRLDGEIESLRQQKNALETEALQLNSAQAALVAGLAAMQQQKRELGNEMRRREERLEAHQARIQQMSRRVMDANFSVREASGKVDELAEKTAFLQKNIGQHQQALAQALEEAAQLDAAPLKLRLDLALREMEEKDAALRQARVLSAELAQKTRECDETRQKCVKAIDPLREKAIASRMKEQEALITEAQFADLLQGAEVTDTAETASALQGQIDRLDGEIAALGAVNLAAFDELEAARIRLEYLDSQHRDLTEAVAMLIEAIRRIDAETRGRLKATYDQVNGYFGELFALIFGGGNAALVMKGDEIIDMGLEIMAQPPGKKNASIHLLSGGEKALTAISLVFSLFRLNPAPFCLLDEVDAPLDDSNTLRFCDMVRKMAEHTQFLFISHNKISMEMAQQLIGVTMQEKGVSRIVAVDIEQTVAGLAV